MDDTAKHGQLEVVRWLHENRDDGCSESAMDYAAWRGHLDTIKWLHDNRSEGCTTTAMDFAAGAGHLEVVKWLHENRSEGCTTDAMNNAARNGHLDIAKWLHANRTEGCTTDAMNYESGHLDVLQWLHENRSEGCSTATMSNAAGKGHLDIVKWLHENRNEGCTPEAMGRAVKSGYFDVVLFLHANRNEGCAFHALKYGFMVIKCMQIMQWMNAHYPGSVDIVGMASSDLYMACLLEHTLGGEFMLHVEEGTVEMTPAELFLSIVSLILNLGISSSKRIPSRVVKFVYSRSLPVQCEFVPQSNHRWLLDRRPRAAPVALLEIDSNPAPPPLPPLTSVLAALRSDRGAQVASLPHVVAAISDFLDCAVPHVWSLPRACETNLLSLLHRLASRGTAVEVDPNYWSKQCSEGLVSAVKYDNLEMVKWLHLCCPSVPPYSAMIEVARTERMCTAGVAVGSSRERSAAPVNDGQSCIGRSNNNAQVSA